MEKFSDLRDVPATILPVVTPDAGRDTNPFDDVIDRAWNDVSDLTQYDQVTLNGTNDWVIRSDSTLAQLGRAIPDAAIERSGILNDAFYVTFADPTVAVERLDGAAGVSQFYPSVVQERSKRLIPNDPQFGQQWHLRNTGQGGGVAGIDANVTGAWDITQGAGVVIGIVDDGVQLTHPDISPNYRTDLDRDFNDNDNNPSPQGSFDFHGTPVAGIAAARGGNGVGVSGAAPQAQLAGLRLISDFEPDSVEAQALTWNNDDIDIFSNSWGPADFAHLEGPGPLTAAALASTATTGRDGLGGIITWAGGNGGNSDNSNYDGYANSRHTIAVGAINNFGDRASYSERGSNLLVVAPSDGGSRDIVTTAINSGYTSSFGGTSAATPLASGVIALMLSANPNLTYRDVQHILVQTAETVDPSDSTWQTNGAGFTVSEAYGHGNIDALAAVQAAQTWTNVGPEVGYTTGNLVVNQTIPDNNSGGITAQVNVEAGLVVEHVEVYFDASHSFTGDLELILTSPDGTESFLHRTSFDSDNYTDWTYNSTLHWGEESDGVWTLNVRDRFNGDVGTFQNWSLNLFGTQPSEVSAPVLTESSFRRGQSAQSLFEFDANVNIDNAVFEIINTSGGETPNASDFALNFSGGLVTATYAPDGVLDALPNGNYIATLSGVAAADDTSVVADPVTSNFYFLNGDTDGDRDVDLFDALNLQRSFGDTDNPLYSDGDLDYDNDVDLFDALILVRNFGENLPEPAGFGTGGARFALGGNDARFGTFNGGNVFAGASPSNSLFGNSGRSESRGLARELI
ncbi:MAG: S8 family serine peptidase [Planctomycetota bacterium]